MTRPTGTVLGTSIPRARGRPCAIICARPICRTFPRTSSACTTTALSRTACWSTRPARTRRCRPSRDRALTLQSGQSAVVTGASSGIGQAIALALAAEGLALSLLGRDNDRLAVVTRAEKARTRDVGWSAVDIVDARQVENYAKQ